MVKVILPRVSKYVKRTTRARRPNGRFYRRRPRMILTQGVGVPNEYKFIRRAGTVSTEAGVWPPNTVASITAIGGTPLYGWFGASLYTMSNVTDFSNLFDQFRIDMFKLTFSTRYSGTSPASVPSATLYYVVDTNDDDPPTSVNQLREYRYCKIRYLNNSDKRTVSVSWKPKINYDVLDSNNGSVQPLFSPWINFNTSAINQTFLGLKYALILDAPATDSVTVDLEAKFTITCKNVQ